MNKETKPKVKSNIYFTQQHEDSIIRYALTTDYKERSKMFEAEIFPILKELIEKIVYTYNFTKIPNIESLKDECAVYLVTILNKFDPNKGSKAFSYFTVITRNWFFNEKKKANSQQYEEANHEDLQELRLEKEQNLIVYHENLEHREKSEFLKNLIMEIEDFRDLPDISHQEKRVAEGILILFEHIEEIEVMNKKVFYFYMKEITGYNTKQIVTCIKKMRPNLRKFTFDWADGEI